MDYFPRKSLSKYLTDTIDFNKHVLLFEILFSDKIVISSLRGYYTGMKISTHPVAHGE
jgi:hypothetical protein